MGLFDRIRRRLGIPRDDVATEVQAIADDWFAGRCDNFKDVIEGCTSLYEQTEPGSDLRTLLERVLVEATTEAVKFVEENPGSAGYLGTPMPDGFLDTRWLPPDYDFTPRSHAEPISFRGPEGRARVGYLGDGRWRVRNGAAALDVGDAHAAVATVLDEVLPGLEVPEQALLTMTLAREEVTFTKARTFTHGWSCFDGEVRFDVGPRAALHAYLEERIAALADRAWVRGVHPTEPPPLAPRFSFAAFGALSDPAPLCAALRDAITQRMASHPSPRTALLSAVDELREAGHDLWSWTGDPDGTCNEHAVWGWDYVRAPRAGAGLRITVGDEDDENAAQLLVEFDPSAPRRPATQP